MNPILDTVAAAVCVTLLIWIYRTVHNRMMVSKAEDVEQERLTELLNQHHMSEYHNNPG